MPASLSQSFLLHFLVLLLPTLLPAQLLSAHPSLRTRRFPPTSPSNPPSSLLPIHEDANVEKGVEDLIYEIYVIPHSHCDAGYKKTVEGYYLTEVQSVLNSVTDALTAHPDYRFVWAEASYLWRWWIDPATLP
ncbi:hypothetical protein VYU27_006840, partial [Nannochloropsis oceanica]